MRGENYHENRGRVSRVILNAVNDNGAQQLVDYDGVSGEVHTKVLRIQPHGFTSRPPAGSEGVMVALNSRDTPVALGGEHPKHRPTGLREGGSRQYDTAGSYVDCDADGSITIKAGGKKVTVDAPQEIMLRVGGVSIKLTSGGIEIVGNITQQGGITSSGPHKAAGHI